MKIKSIRRTGPELYLVTYSRRWRSDVERWVIAEPQKHEGIFTKTTKMHFHYRDVAELAHDCWHQIEWMIRNNIEFFDNTQSPDPVWPRPARFVKEKVTIPNIPDFPPIPDKKAYETRHLRLLRNTKSDSEFSCYDCLNVSYEYCLAGNKPEALYWYNQSKKKAFGKESAELKERVERLLKIKTAVAQDKYTLDKKCQTCGNYHKQGETCPLI